MAQAGSALHLSLAAARGAVIAVQGLAGAHEARLVPTLEETGFIRTLGGVDVYLAARARVAGLGRAALDAAVQAHDVQVVPAVRGCIYLVARSHVPLALRIADLLSRGRDQREHEKAGIRPGEIDALGQAVLEVLEERGPLTTDGLRKALPPGAVRSLGPTGKKVGLSSPLPPALRRLELDGRIERTLEAGRLDTERYLWRVCRQDPFSGAAVPGDPAELHARVAEVFFRTAGLGSIKELAAWTGLSQRDAKAAAARLPLVPVAVEGIDEPQLALEALRPILEQPTRSEAAVALLPFEDNLVALHGGAAFWVDPAHHGLTVGSWGSSGTVALGQARHMMVRAVLAEGRVSGLWEYDPDARAVVWSAFDRLGATTRRRVDQAAEETARFLAEEMGHGHSFSLDTDDELRRRVALVRSLAG